MVHKNIDAIVQSWLGCVVRIVFYGVDNFGAWIEEDGEECEILYHRVSGGWTSLGKSQQRRMAG